jgi:hypothetical protein
MTEKQLGNAVLRGRKITFARTGEQPITGYLGGLDSESFLVLVPELDGIRNHLLSRSASSWQELHQAATLVTETYHEQLELILEPFRKWVQEELLQRSSSKNR